MTSASPSDAQLLDAWQAGSQTAATLLVERYLVRLTALVRSRMSHRLSRRTDPEDIVLSAWRSFFVSAGHDRFEPSSESLWPLLVTFTLRKLSRHVERHTSERRSVDRELALDDASLISGDPSPDAAAAVTDELEAFLVNLDPADRKIVELRLAGATQLEIAGELNVAERTIRRRLERLGRRLNGSLPGRHVSPTKAQPAATAGPTVDYSEFVLESMIGEGRFAKVYRAVRKMDSNPIAVKFLKRRFWHDERSVRALLNESQIVEQLDCPYVIRHHGWGRAPHGGVFLTMDLVEGLSGWDWIKTSPSMTSILSIVRQLALALNGLHRAGIVHGDLNPSNILVSKNDQLTLTDFGFAQHLASFDREFAGGTLPFLAPEELSAAFGAPSFQTDIYSFGALVYTLLAGQPPFVAEDVNATIAIILSEKSPLPIQQNRPDTPSPLASVITAALQKAAGRRPSCMSEILQRLGNA